MDRIAKVTKSLDKKRIDHILVQLGLTDSRQKANSFIISGYVFVNDRKIVKPGTSVRYDSIIKLKLKEHEWVSRGGIKLDYALKYFNINTLDKSCIDIGSSTGGFTDVLLHRKAKKIFCVDVGYGQLAWKIRNNEKVVVYEKFNAKNITIDQTGVKLDILVCDVSFISIKKIIPTCLKILNKNAILIILIKPQFEAGREKISKGGIVKDPKTHEFICKEIRDWFEERLNKKVIGIVESPIKGQKGNKEFLIAVIN
ncbi:TlyA family RNA methyltransferase [Rickettsiales bacterium]|nr:TlyA family RNA methyltransferase [Rickettsiales bacterium]